MSKTKAVWRLGTEVEDGGEIRLYRDDCQRGFCDASHSNELRRILKRGQAKPKTCVWSIDPVDCIVTTGCGHVTCWDDDPRDKAHKILFCHACGGKIMWRKAK